MTLDNRVRQNPAPSGEEASRLLRPLVSNPAVFIYLVLDRAKANLALARIELKSFEGKLTLG